jgi:hypothetical protein
MKNKKGYMLHLFALILTFLAFAFVQAEINPFKWGIEIRAFMVLLIAVFQFIVFVYRSN